MLFVKVSNINSCDESPQMICPVEVVPAIHRRAKWIPEIHKIYFNRRHTTIEWADGEKTTVGCIEGQEFDEYSGFTAAIAKRLFGSSSAAIRCMNEHKEAQPDPAKKMKKGGKTPASEMEAVQDA